MNVETIIVAAIAASGGVLGGAGAAEAVKGMLGRKPKNVVAVENDVRLAQQAAAQAASSAAYAAQMQEAARQAWAQSAAAEARTAQVSREAGDRADELERRADGVQFKLDVCARYVVWLLDLIGEPTMTMESLRDNVSRHRPPAGVGRERS